LGCEFFRDRRLADSGFQAGVGDPMPQSVRVVPEISFAPGTLDRGIDVGILN
jgi:hypothetical protein